MGNILTIVTIIASLWGFHQANVKRIHAIEFKVGLMWKHFANRFNLPEELQDVTKE